MANIVLIGAGSASFSLALLKDLILRKSLWGSRVTLVDIDAERLAIAEKLATRYCDAFKADISFAATVDRKKGLEGADFVICAVKVGGYDPLEAERKIAEEQGYYRGIGDRVSCYYGGVGAYHQLKFLMDLAADMERICPDAWLIQTANPVFEGTNIVTRHTKIKAVGVCHGHFGYHAVAHALGLNPDDVSVQIVGFNHYTWLTHFRHKGRDAYPLIDRWIAERSESVWSGEEYSEQMSPGAVDTYRMYGLFPIGDAVRCAGPWWHHTDQKSKERWYGRSGPFFRKDAPGGFDCEIQWNRYLQDKVALHQELVQLVKQPTAALIEKHPLKSSGEQHIPIVDAIVNNKETVLELNVPNDGCLDGVPDDVLVEIPTVVSGRGIQGVRVGRLPASVMNHSMIPRLIRLENILNAYMNRDRKTLVLMLMDDPRTRSFEQAKRLIDTLLAQPWNAGAAAHYR